MHREKMNLKPTKEGLTFIWRREELVCASKSIRARLTRAFNRDFLVFVMKEMGFYDLWLAWIAECVNTPAFSILVNGTQQGDFRSDNGLRQGDPLAPYLLTILMEAFSSILNDAILKKEMTPMTNRPGLAISLLIFWQERLKSQRKQRFEWPNPTSRSRTEDQPAHRQGIFVTHHSNRKTPFLD